jgi:hypothetical protein
VESSRGTGFLIGGGTGFLIGFLTPLVLAFDWQRWELTTFQWVPASIALGLFFGVLGIVLGSVSGLWTRARQPRQPRHEPRPVQTPKSSDERIKLIHRIATPADDSGDNQTK